MADGRLGSRSISTSEQPGAVSFAAGVLVQRCRPHDEIYGDQAVTYAREEARVARAEMRGEVSDAASPSATRAAEADHG